MRPYSFSSEIPSYFPSSQSSAIPSEVSYNTPSELPVGIGSIVPILLIINAPISLESVIPGEIRSYGPSFGISRLVSNVLLVVPIAHGSRSPSKITMPNTFP